MYEASKTKNGGVAIDGPTQGSMNGPVGQAWNRAFCYKLQVLNKFSICYFNTNISTPVFRSFSIIICNYHRVSGENLVMQAQ
jgi:hypothetical protein